MKGFHSPGWWALRIGRVYVYWRDVRRHRLLFSERNRLGRRRLLAVGNYWELWISRRSA